MASLRKWGGICKCKIQVYHKAWSFYVRGPIKIPFQKDKHNSKPFKDKQNWLQRIEVVPMCMHGMRLLR